MLKYILKDISSDNRKIFFAWFFWGLGEGLFVFIYPVYLQKLGATPAQVGMIIAISSAVMGLSHLPAGMLADLFGRKRLIVSGYLIALLATALMFLAQDLSIFSIGWVLYMFTGFTSSPMNAYISQARGSQSAQAAISTTASGYWLSMMISPSVGGLLSIWLGTRWLFAVAFIIFLFPTVMLFSIKDQNHTHVKEEAQITRPSYRQTLRNPLFIRCLISFFVAFLAVNFGHSLVPNFLANVRNLDMGNISMLGSATSIGIVIITLSLREGQPRTLFLLGLGILVVQQIVLLKLTGLPWYILIFFMRSGLIMLIQKSVALVNYVVPSNALGMAMGLQQTVVSLASTLGPMAGGLLFEVTPALPFQFSFGFLIVSIVLFLILVPSDITKLSIPTVLQEPALPAE